MSQFKLLILSLVLLLTTPAFAGTITVQPFSADSSVTHMENFRGTVVTVINGNIAGGSGGTSSVNILANSIGEIEMADDANPRVFANELLNIGSDSFSSGTLTQNTYLDNGLVPATDTDLTSDISAGTAYVNGYRVNKGATSNTYSANVDTYVDLNQSGTYTFSEVAVGATQPTVATNSIRLAKVTTNGTQITTVTAYPTGRIPGLVIPANYRDGLSISRDTATALTVGLGTAELNNTMVTKTSVTTLSLTTAGDWAGGSGLRAANTYGFVGADISGNLKLHTTAPTHDNYAVSSTVGKRRYATWSSTVYRILGWFYMDGAQNVDTSGNIREGNLSNAVISSEVAATSTASTSDVPAMALRFYSSGNPVRVSFNGDADWDAGAAVVATNLSMDSAALQSERRAGDANATNPQAMSHNFLHTPSQSTHTYNAMFRTSSSTGNLRRKELTVQEL